MRAATSLLAALVLFGVFPSTNSLAAERPRTMTLTFDDLPYAAGPHGDTLPRAQRVTDAILAVLERYTAPATAFVNEGKLQRTNEVDARIALLEQWVDAGAILGNHTFSHLDLNSTSVEDFERDIVQGEVVFKRLMKPREPYPLYFRHPYTHTGDTEEKKVEVERFLADRGYVVTPHTIDAQDALFNRIYLDRKSRGDDAGAARICAAYVEFAGQATAFAEDVSAQIFGYEVPQTLLLHANDINADCLDVFLDRCRARGYRFVSLDSVMSDPAYRTRDTLVTRYGPTWLWRWRKSKGLDISFRGDPEPPDWILEQYRQAQRADHADATDAGGG